MFKTGFLRWSKSRPRLEFLETKEHYIPLRAEVLMERILLDRRLTPENETQFREFSAMLAARFHFDYHAELESLKSDFVAFDPDRDTLVEPEFTPAELAEKSRRLYRGVERLLKVGNFVEMTSTQLDACLELQPVGGLSVHVDKDDFAGFKVFYRGIREKEVREPRFYLFQQKRLTTIFSRVFVLARLKEEHGGELLAKLFKDVAVENLKIIVPKVRLGMPVFDRLKIGGTVFGSLATSFYKLIFAFALSWWVFALVLSGLVIAASKGIMSFLSSKTKYMQVYSSSLYFRSISNNKAAIAALVDTAEEQEVKEALLAYFMLFVLRDRDLTEQELDCEIEHWIEEQFGVELDFEVDDALRKLEEKGLFTSNGEHYKVYDLPSVLRRLDEAWDGIFPYANTVEAATDRVADASWPPFPDDMSCEIQTDQRFTFNSSDANRTTQNDPAL